MRKEIPLGDEFFTPQEVAELLKIKKNTVYELIKRGDLKCRKIGKQFRVLKDDLDAYLNLDKMDTSGILKSHKEQINHLPISFHNENQKSQYTEEILFKDMDMLSDRTPLLTENQRSNDSNQLYHGRTTNKGIVLCGQDILLEILCNYMARQFKNIPIYRSYQGSYNGLYALYQDEVDVATVHLWDGASGEYNRDYVKRMLPGTRYIRVHLVNRLQGFYVQSGNPKNITDFHDFLRADVRMINREKGSGTRILLDEKLLGLGLDKTRIIGYDREVNSHLACAGAIARKSADVSIGVERISKEMTGVDFIPIQMESYDLVVKEEHARSDWFKQIIKILNHDDFRTEVMGMSGYDITDMGKVMK
ncbi:MAG: DNA-binding protein excisionase family [Anaerocolumna sp.]|nr:DNA-binding protein excisionase family [Anaerocolumna sp.]